MILLDGSAGEGGGQILRSALALSMVTGKPFRIENIRAGREKPGLLRQHMTAVRAAVLVSGGAVEGAALGSKALEFHPKQVRSGDYEFDVGTAGSTTLVLQTVLLPLLLAEGPARLTIKGGTHNPFAPPFEFLREAFLPLVGRMGARVEAELLAAGFFPAGGGAIRVEITPAGTLAPLDLALRGKALEMRAKAIVAKLPRHVAERELATLASRLRLRQSALLVEERPECPLPANALSVAVLSEHVTEVFTGLGERGLKAEAVAARVAEEVEAYLASGVPIWTHLSDQLVLPMAIAGRGSFLTVKPTSHTTTNVETIRRFLDVPIALEPRDDGSTLVKAGQPL